MSRSDAPEFRELDACVGCKFFVLETVNDKAHCAEYHIALLGNQSYRYVCNSFKDWRIKSESR